MLQTKHLRFQLAISYAAIALLAALLLGGILLGILYRYYTGLERSYLEMNAEAIGTLVGGEVSVENLQRQVESFAFFSNAQVQVFNPDGVLLADSGLPQTSTAFQIETSSDIFASGVVVSSEFPLALSGETGVVDLEQAYPVALPSSPAFYSVEAFGVSQFPGYVISTVGGQDAPIESGQYRSNQVIRRAFTGSDGDLGGYVELSNSPAYGRSILTSVAWGWLIAGSIAVFLAALAGLLVSRRFSQPLVDLAAVTTEMAAGRLSARANVRRQDEFGMLAVSFNQMAEQVETKMVALQRFAGDAAHELYTPLTALRTDLELAAAEVGVDASLEHLQQALSQVERMDGITRGLLALSRLEAAQLVHPFEPVNLVEFTAQASESFASRAEQKDLGFSLNLSSQPLVVMADAIFLGSMLSNLMDNAIKFTPSGGRVAVALNRDGEEAVMSISDTGIGIPEADRPLLFNRFHRGRNVAAYPGSGLGLALVKGVVDHHKGRIEIFSTSPGTTVQIWLPLAAGN